VVFSRSLPPAEGVTILDRDPVEDLIALKRAEGRDIMLSCGPELLAPLATAPGLIDEYLFAVHPAVLGTGKRVFDGMTSDLALRLVDAKAFDAGAVVLRYAPLNTL
jgi:dihydrofolate reductase